MVARIQDDTREQSDAPSAQTGSVLKSVRSADSTTPLEVKSGKSLASSALQNELAATPYDYRVADTSQVLSKPTISAAQRAELEIQGIREELKKLHQDQAKLTPIDHLFGAAEALDKQETALLDRYAALQGGARGGNSVPHEIRQPTSNPIEAAGRSTFSAVANAFASGTTPVAEGVEHSRQIAGNKMQGPDFGSNPNAAKTIDSGVASTKIEARPSPKMEIDALTNSISGNRQDVIAQAVRATSASSTLASDPIRSHRPELSDGPLDSYLQKINISKADLEPEVYRNGGKELSANLAEPGQKTWNPLVLKNLPETIVVNGVEYRYRHVEAGPNRPEVYYVPPELMKAVLRETDVSAALSSNARGFHLKRDHVDHALFIPLPELGLNYSQRYQWGSTITHEHDHYRGGSEASAYVAQGDYQVKNNLTSENKWYDSDKLMDHLKSAGYSDRAMYRSIKDLVDQRVAHAIELNALDPLDTAKLVNLTTKYLDPKGEFFAPALASIGVKSTPGNLALVQERVSEDLRASYQKEFLAREVESTVTQKLIQQKIDNVFSKSTGLNPTENLSDPSLRIFSDLEKLKVAGSSGMDRYVAFRDMLDQQIIKSGLDKKLPTANTALMMRAAVAHLDSQGMDMALIALNRVAKAEDMQTFARILASQISAKREGT